MSLEAAREALRKARATMDCWFTSIKYATTAKDDCAVASLEELAGEHHPQVASALLDGFSVDELTAVGG